MKCITKKSLLTALIVAMLALACAFSVMHYGKIAFADAQTTPSSIKANISDMTEENTTTYVENPGFGVLDQAEIRVATEGIKFKTEITETYFNGLLAEGNKVEFIAVAKNLTTSMSVAVEFANKPEFTDDENANETFVLNTYFNFDNLGSADKTAVYAMDFTTETYAKVTDSEEKVSYYKAFDPVTVTRSMRAVANATVLNYVDEDADGFDINDLNPDYFIEGARDEGVSAYTFKSGENGWLWIKFPEGAPVANEEGVIPNGTTVYVGAKKLAVGVDLIYDKDIGRYKLNYEQAKSLKLGAEEWVSVFTADNTVYSTKAVQATPIATESDMKNSLSGDVVTEEITGYYLLTNDINMTETWATNMAIFSGVFDGQGYTIDNFKTSAVNAETYRGMFIGGGATVKNFGLKVTSMGNTTGAIFAKTVENTTNSAENIFVHINKVSGHGSAGICGLVPGGVLNVSDVMITIGELGGGKTGGHVVWNLDRDRRDSGNLGPVATANLTNVHASILRASQKLVYAGSNIQTKCGLYEYFSDIYNGINEGTIEITETLRRAIDKLKPWIEITAENFTELQDSTGNKYFILAEDVDASAITEWVTTSVGSQTAFSGVLDGNGHVISNWGENVSSPLLGGYVSNGAIARNLILDSAEVTNSPLWNQMCAGTVTVENIVASLRSNGYNSATDSTRVGLLGWATGANLIVNNVLVDIWDKTNATSSGFLTNYISVGDYKINNVYGIGNFGLYGEQSKSASGYNNGVLNIFGPDGATKATPGKEYNIYASEEALFNAMNASENAVDLPTFIKDNLEKAHIITELNEKNFTTLLNAWDGYYYLTDNINFSEVDINGDGKVDKNDVWQNARIDRYFVGTLDGNENAINNFVPGGNWASLFSSTYHGAVIKDIAIHVPTMTAHKGLTGRLRGNTLFENVVLKIEAINGSNATAFSSVLTATATIKDCIVYYGKNAENATEANTGWLASPNGFSKGKLVVSNTYIVCENTVMTAPFSTNADTSKAVYASDGTTKAQANTDYFVYSDLTTFNSSLSKEEIVLPTNIKTMATNLGLISVAE